jgi:hypothetical protein
MLNHSEKATQRSSFLSQRLALCIGVFAITMSTTVLAEPPQSNSYTTVEVTSGTSVQLGYHASAKKDCSPAPLPTIRVIEVPRSGRLTVRRGVLTINTIAGCPGLKTPAQIAFYVARAGSGGKDHLIYEVTNFNGEVDVYDVTIEIKEQAKSNVGGEKGQPI